MREVSFGLRGYFSYKVEDNLSDKEALASARDRLSSLLNNQDYSLVLDEDETPEIDGVEIIENEDDDWNEDEEIESHPEIGRVKLVDSNGYPYEAIVRDMESKTLPNHVYVNIYGDYGERLVLQHFNISKPDDKSLEDVVLGYLKLYDVGLSLA